MSVALVAGSIRNQRAIDRRRWTVSAAIASLQAMTPMRGSKQRPALPKTIVLFVNGTLMRGEPLHGNLAGAKFLGSATTAPRYRLFSVHDVHPAMLRQTSGPGAAVKGEL